MEPTAWEKIKQIIFDNWRTTIAGLVFGFAGFLKGFGIDIAEGSLHQVVDWIVSLGPAALLIFGAKDAADKKEGEK